MCVNKQFLKMSMINKTFRICYLIIVAFIFSNSFIASGQVIISEKHIDSLIAEYGDDSIQIFKVGLPPIDSIGNFQETYFEIKKNKFIPSFLEFKTGGTETNVFILKYNKEFDLIKMFHEKDYIRRIDFGINLESGNLMEISDLELGKYRILYCACSIGGQYVVNIIE